MSSGKAAASILKDMVAQVRDFAVLWREQATTIVSGWAVKTTPYVNLDDAPLESTEEWAWVDTLDEPIAGDEIVMAMMGSRPVVLGKLVRAAVTVATISRDLRLTRHLRSNGGVPTFSSLTPNGTTGAVVRNWGDDNAGVFTITPGGTGITSGAAMKMTFAVARAGVQYIVVIVPRNAAAQTYGIGGIMSATHATTDFNLNFPVALVSGTAYSFGYLIVENG